VLGEADLEEKVVEERLMNCLTVAACCVEEGGYISVELWETEDGGQQLC